MMESMSLLKILLLLLLFSAAPTLGQLSWQVPNGRPVMVDGKLNRGEWDDAAVRGLPGLAKVRIKQSDEYVFLAFALNNGDGAGASRARRLMLKFTIPPLPYK
jgi:hypothetical protein